MLLKKITREISSQLGRFQLSKNVADADVVAESAEDMFPSFKCMVFCNGFRRDGNHETRTRLQLQRMGDASLLKEVSGEQWPGMAFKKYIYEIKRARGESMTSWINRSDEALMDVRKKLATAPGANSSESTMIPPQIQGWLLLHRARLRDQDIVGVMTSNLLKNLFLICSPMMSSSQLIALMARRTLEILETSTLFRQLKRFQRMMTTPISMMT